jgi:hypothetical protein
MAKSSVRDILKSLVKAKAGAAPKKAVTPKRDTPAPGKSAVAREPSEDFTSQSKERPAPKNLELGRGGETVQSASPEPVLDADDSSELSSCPPEERDQAEIDHVRFEIDDLREAKAETRLRGLSRGETDADLNQIANRILDAESQLVRAEGARIAARSVTQIGQAGVPTKRTGKGLVGSKGRLKRSGRSPRS